MWSSTMTSRITRDGPDQLGKMAEGAGVAVELVGSEENLKIARSRWPRTKPARTMPLTAMTAFLPLVVVQKRHARAPGARPVAVALIE